MRFMNTEEAVFVPLCTSRISWMYYQQGFADRCLNITAPVERRYVFSGTSLRLRPAIFADIRSLMMIFASGADATAFASATAGLILLAMRLRIAHAARRLAAIHEEVALYSMLTSRGQGRYFILLRRRVRVPRAHGFIEWSMMLRIL